MADRPSFLNLTALRARGWTPAMVMRLLGKEDQTWRNPIYRQAAPQRMYQEERVLAAEATPAFEEARAKSLRRSERARAVALHQKHALLAEIAQLHVAVTQMDAKTLRKQAIAHHRRRQFGRRHDADGVPPDGAMLERITVNFIRHELTHYDEQLAALYGRVGKEAAVFAVRQRVYAAIATAYPDLTAECARQLELRRLEMPEPASTAPAEPPGFGLHGAREADATQRGETP